MDTLQWPERLHYRDRLRTARYAALADAEAFGEICFTVEAIGLRLSRKEGTLGSYFDPVKVLAEQSVVLSEMPGIFPQLFSRFGALYRTAQAARNDAMHSGVYARHATTAAIELCIGLEEALMVEQQHPRTKVEDYMVRSPIIVQPWQPVAYARQLMLMHSFSFLPVNLDGWKLVPEASMAKFLHRNGERKAVLARSIQEAARLDERPLELVNAQVVTPHDNVEVLLNAADVGKPTLWLVDDGHGGLAGVLSPFELM